MGSLSLNISININDREFKRLFNNVRFVAVFNKHMSRQFLTIGEQAKRLIARQINSEDYPPLGVWRFIKGSSSVLYFTGSLSKAWTYRFNRGTNKAVVGITVLPKGTHPSGIAMSKLAKILHNGVSWVPSAAQRQKLAIMAAQAGAPGPDGAKKEIWTIPPRPFVRDALISSEFVSKVQLQTMTVLFRTFNELKRG